jgi:carbon dioxide concentrating mechanism protein CcmN
MQAEVGKMRFSLQPSSFLPHSSSFLIRMHLPTLPSSSNSHVYAEGDVSIDASAAIAPGAILRADVDSKIVIAAGVCIGMGAVIHASGGTLEVEAGANLGAGVLFVGKGTIGANACIGAITTIWNTSIEPWQVVPAASIVGNQGRQIAEVSSGAVATPSTETPNTSDSSSTTSVTSQESLNGQVPSNRAVTSTPTTDEDSPTQPEEQPPPEAGKTVYGQSSLERILKTLLPYNQSLNRSPEDG